MKKVSVAEAKAGLSSLLKEVAYKGERVLILSRGKPQAVLINMEELREIEEGSMAKGVRALHLADELVDRIGKRRKQTRGVAEDVLTAVREERIRDLTK